MPQPNPETTRRVHLVGLKMGAVRNLAGFRKGYHKIPALLPDPAYERQFPAMCAPDLEQLGRTLFEQLRAARGYKRREISLHVSPDHPAATLNTTDFVLDLGYALDPEAPGDFQLTHDLHDIRNVAVFGDAALDGALAGLFNRVRLAFARPVRVEEIIDDLEERPGGSSQLEYPPDFAECTVRLPEFPGEVVVRPDSLEIISPVSTSPTELVKTFVHATEVLAVNPTLDKLLRGQWD